MFGWINETSREQADRAQTNAFELINESMYLLTAHTTCGADTSTTSSTLGLDGRQLRKDKSATQPTTHTTRTLTPTASAATPRTRTELADYQ